MKIAERYPYDPRAKIELLTDLDKLRAIEDRELAENLAALFESASNKPLKSPRGQLALKLVANG